MLFNNLFADYLKEKSRVNPNIINNQLQKCNEKHILLYVNLIKENIFPEKTMYKLLASFFNIDYHPVLISEVNYDLIKKFKLDKLIEYKAIPYLEVDNKIYFSTSLPNTSEDLNALVKAINEKYNACLAIFCNSDIEKVLDYITNKLSQSNAILSINKEIPEKNEETKDIEIDAPIIKLCDSILYEAVSVNASDIHIEIYDKKVRIRFRIDGLLREVYDIPYSNYQAVLARYKIMANMNIAERRIPQDGKISLKINDVLYDFRVSTLPTIFGEKIVIRIYNVEFNASNFENLGFDKKQEEIIVNMITRPHGIVLLNGPTGSGKSTTLYTFLRKLNRVDDNIITVEDPIENQIYGINQVQVNNLANFTFASALRSILRQDPNIIMIGEIRDEETAQIATRAAITGHLVLSTIHTNDAVGTIGRLINMGIPRYLVSDALIGAISQRLIKKLCPYCKKRHKTTKEEMQILKLDKPMMIHQKCGCKYCNNTGYLGRTGVFEILISTKELRNAIMDNNMTNDKLEQIATSNGKTSLLDEVRSRVLAGVTSIEEYEKLFESVRF